jgi:capsular exopolysaccharide synthesis family protein
MSKIFEALQRAQQQSGPGGESKGVAVDNSAPGSSVPMSPSSVEVAPGPPEPPPIWQSTPSIPPAPQGMFFSDPAVAAPSAASGNALRLDAVTGSSDMLFATPPAIAAYPSASGYASVPYPSAPPFPGEAPVFDDHSGDPSRMAGYGSPIPAGSLPLHAAPEESTPAVWEPPSIVRFAPRSKVVVAQNPTSLAAEQYRVLRTNIIKLSQTQALKVILITSPGPGDGKTLTTMNLALSFCQKPDTRVLLIEADLRKPSVGALVAMDPGPGLADYLAGEASLEQVVRPTSIPNFHLLDSGKHSSTPADLLHSPRLGSMMEVLRSHFNWIVLDGPPTNPVADYELLTPICDGVVLVVRPFYTQRDLLRLTTEALRGRKVLGCVVNGSKHFERYGSAYGYGYGYGPGNYAEPSAPQKKKMRKKKSGKLFGGYSG